ncbi:hypothetical protein [Paraburkholderia acidisoli]|uniref:Uncharacterized protein n=1 Tax=Paraburkholderia acidisoli TaxID=2571748 RepID=A0A7Z2JJ07_9BURK|nr:hypothetical protein [Paraburkholderia acidisoli]QGZ64880.1 hypothetical protein FAZ98_24020 [Paraburkholderia acidisoli]
MMSPPAHVPAPEPESGSRSAAPTRAQRVAVGFALLGVPLVWAAHVLLCQWLAATTCTGGVVQRNAQSWSVVHGTLAVFSALAFALSLAGALAARRVLREATRFAAPQRETFRFLAWCGTAVAIAFTVALMFTICVLFALPLERLCGALS